MELKYFIFLAQLFGDKIFFSIFAHKNNNNLG